MSRRSSISRGGGGLPPATPTESTDAGGGLASPIARPAGSAVTPFAREVASGLATPLAPPTALPPEMAPLTNMGSTLLSLSATRGTGNTPGGKAGAFGGLPSPGGAAPLPTQGMPSASMQRRRSSVARAADAAVALRPEVLSMPAIMQPTCQWRWAGAQPATHDRPALRHEIMAVLNRYDYVMSHYERVANMAVGGNENPAGGDAVLDADFTNCRNAARRIFAEKKLPGDAGPVLPRGTNPQSPEIQFISAPALQSLPDSANGINVSAGPRQISVTDRLLAQIMDTPVFQDCALELGLTLYEQKWTDLTLGETQAQVAINSHEHGSLLFSIRQHYAHCVNSLLSTILRLSLGLQQGHAAIASMHAEVMAARQARGEVEKVIRAEYDAQRSIFEQEVRDAKEAAERQVAQAHEQVEKLSESLNSLNAVFQKLRGEEDLLKIADLKEAAARLERRLADRTRELEAMQPLKIQLRQTETLLEEERRNSFRLQAELTELRNELTKQVSLTRAALQGATRDLGSSTVESLRSDALLDEERSSGASQHRKPNTTSHATSSTVLATTSRGAPSWANAALDKIRSSTLAATRALLPGVDFLCVRCNNALNAAIERQGEDSHATDAMPLVAASSVWAQGSVGHKPGAQSVPGAGGAPGTSYVPCKNYRALLPALPAVDPIAAKKMNAVTASVHASKYALPAKAGVGAAGTTAGAPGAAAPTPSEKGGTPLDAALRDALADVAYPKRPVAWIRWCMRAITMSKMRDDSAFQADALPSQVISRKRIPEFAYAWFEGFSSGASSVQPAPPASGSARAAQPLQPWAGVGKHTLAREALAVQGLPGLQPAAALTSSAAAPGALLSGAASSASSAAAAVSASPTPAPEVDEATAWGMPAVDVARWAFYFGLRALARDDAEAKLFYALLDERHGEEEETFYLYALHAMQATLPTPLLWGPTSASSDFADIPAHLHNEEAVLRVKHRLAAQAKSKATRAPDGAPLELPLDVRGYDASRRASITAAAAPPPTMKEQVVSVPPDQVWVPLTFAMFAAARVTAQAPEADRKALLQRLQARSVSSEGRIDNSDSALLRLPPRTALEQLVGIGGVGSLAAKVYGDSFQAQFYTHAADLYSRKRYQDLTPLDGRCIDLSIWLRVLLLEFREEQARRRATIRMLFTLAMSNAATAAASGGKGSLPASGAAASMGLSPSPSAPALGRAAQLQPLGVHAGSNGSAAAMHGHAALPFTGVSFRQFAVIARFVHTACSLDEIAALYRDAGLLGRRIVDYDSFMAAADMRRFFSSAMRLPALVGAERATHLTEQQASDIAFLVVRQVTCLDHDLAPWLAQLAPQWQRIVARAREAVQIEMDECLAPTPALATLLDIPEAESSAPEPSVDAARHAATTDAPHGDGGAGRSDAAHDHLAAASEVSSSVASRKHPAKRVAVNMRPDGRRLLVAYRQYLSILAHMRASNRAERGESGGPLAVAYIAQELQATEAVLRADAPALAPDLLTLKRLTQSGALPRLRYLLQRATHVPQLRNRTLVADTKAAARAAAAIAAQAKAAASAGQPRRGSLASIAPPPGAAPSEKSWVDSVVKPAAPAVEFAVTGLRLATPTSSLTVPTLPLAEPDEDEDISPEEYCYRLGVNAYAGDELVRLRSCEALQALQRAHEEVSRIKIGCALKLHVRRMRQRVLEQKRNRQELAAVEDSLHTTA